MATPVPHLGQSTWPLTAPAAHSVPAPRARRIATVWSGMLEVVRAHLPTLMILGLYTLGGTVAWRAFGLGPSLGSWVSYPKLLGLFTLMSLQLFAIQGLWRFRATGHEGSLFDPAPWIGLARPMITPGKLAEVALFLAVIPPFMDAFRQWKVMIPLISPFRFDPLLHEIDQALHLGMLPGVVAERLLPGAMGVRVLDWLYHPAWHRVLFFAITGCLWHSDRALRQRFLLAYVLVWSGLGTLAATLLASVGPCFYALLTGDAAPYGELLARLQLLHQSAPLSSVAAQEGLWRAYESGSYQVQVGISAMPSLHVAIAVLVALLARSVHPRLGLLGGLFAAVILFGSVRLGWHYAVDGYASAAGTLGLWWAAGRLNGWYDGGRRWGWGSGGAAAAADRGS
jgi:hypothetical protein